MSKMPWNETNPEWWRAQIEVRHEVGDGSVVYDWLVNEWQRVVAIEDAARRYIKHAGQDGKDADDVCFVGLVAAVYGEDVAP